MYALWMVLLIASAPMTLVLFVGLLIYRLGRLTDARHERERAQAGPVSVPEQAAAIHSEKTLPPT